MSLLTQRRQLIPRPNGVPGRNLLLRDGQWQELKEIEKLVVKTGDRVRIETPGGGAWLQDLKTSL
ncbi:hypothetical protein OAG61_02460 [Akkermansiaceae bacterium]|nr:hypothetical protein [Akkermansiaceae bacterium]